MYIYIYMRVEVNSFDRTPFLKDHIYPLLNMRLLKILKFLLLMSMYMQVKGKFFSKTIFY